ncbi:hypothetical protein [Variovorax sp. DXTD-1]|uniref:hypothetical protein n=1 Tax=Variovorax sp. DXTD-1 TaxID=2495592 RepID=UPI000F85B98B|nr:hypothetical protein [Variovorax sp. DXTD-1]RST52507.1 hypothetical protein EJI00_06795 [Variovorax sp. DXTD-1]
MNINTLARKAAKPGGPESYGGAVEVEDLFRFVLFHGEAAADEIERLSRQHGWMMDGMVLPNGNLVRPMGRWAQICVAFGRGGVAALRSQLDDQTSAGFAAAFLAHVASEESVEVLVDYCKRVSWSAADSEHPGWKAMASLNGLLSFDDCVKVSPALLDSLRPIVLAAFAAAPTAALQVLCLCTVRGVPSPGAVAWAEALLPSDPDVLHARNMAVKTMRKRLAPEYKAPTPEQKRQVRRQRVADV